MNKMLARPLTAAEQEVVDYIASLISAHPEDAVGTKDGIEISLEINRDRGVRLWTDGPDYGPIEWGWCDDFSILARCMREQPEGATD